MLKPDFKDRRGISIHAPREGSDWKGFAVNAVSQYVISIHAPREGSDSNISQKEHVAFVRLRDIAQNSV